VRIRAKANTGTVGKLNVTPLIDVIMVLIIFYLIVGKLASDRLELVDLPSSRIGEGDTGGRGTVVISIVPPGNGGVGGLMVDGQVVKIEELPELLRAMGVGNVPDGQIKRAREVRLRADKGLPYGQVEPVLNACREAGVTAIKLVTDRVGEGL